MEIRATIYKPYKLYIYQIELARHSLAEQKKTKMRKLSFLNCLFLHKNDPKFTLFFVYTMSMMCTLSMRQTNRKVRTATQYFRSLWRTEESMLWRLLQESRKGVTVTGSHDMEATGKQTKISWNFNFTRIKHWYQMKEALKSTASRSFWPVCKCSGMGVTSPAHTTRWQLQKGCFSSRIFPTN